MSEGPSAEKDVPLDERLYAAFLDIGLDEGDADRAVAAVQRTISDGWKCPVHGRCDLLGCRIASPSVTITTTVLPPAEGRA